MKLRVSLVLALALLVICSTSAFAEPLFSMTYGHESGSWVYRLFNNDPTGNVVVTGLDIVWDPAVPTSYYQITGTPNGWALNTDYDWPAWDAIGNDPLPGASIKGFAFTAPTAAPHFVVYYNELGMSAWLYGEATTPEPSSLLVLLGGVGALGAMIRRRIA